MTTDTNWEAEIAELLEELATVQQDLLEVLNQKRDCMAAQDLAGIERLQDRESELGDRLQACHDRRGELLGAAAREGLPGTTLQQLAGALTSRHSSQAAQDSQSPGGTPLAQRVATTSQRMRLLQHHSLTNWVLAQRTLLHLSQMLEILATGGRLKPTYGKEDSVHSRGALVDREA